MDLARLLKLLRDLEWMGGGMTRRCLLCRAHRGKEHLADCEMGLAVATLEAGLSDCQPPKLVADLPDTRD